MRFDAKLTGLVSCLVFGGMLAFTMGWIGPLHAKSAYRRGVQLMTQGRTEAAAKELDRALDLEPNSLSIRLAHARVSESAQRWEDARLDYHWVLARYPQSEPAKKGLERIRDVLALAAASTANDQSTASR